MDSLTDFASAKLDGLEAQSLRRRLSPTRRLDGLWVERDGRRLMSFSCNDYLNLSHHPAVKQAAADAARQSEKGGAPVDVRPTARGDAGTLEAIARQLIAQVAADRQHYGAEISALGFPGFMAPERLATDRGLHATRARLTQAAAVVEKYRALQMSRIRDYRDAVAKAGISDVDKQAALARIDSDVSENVIRINRSWDLEADILGEYKQAVEVLARAQGDWVVFHHTLRFSRPADLQAFNSHVQNARNLGKQETEDQAEAREKFDQQMSKAIDENAKAQGGN